MRSFVRPALVALVACMVGAGMLLAQQPPDRRPPQPPPPGPQGPGPQGPGPQGPPPVQGGFGAPLPDLTRAELEEFQTGLEEFRTVERPASGLGPIFNDVSCVACHRAPAIGGSSGTVVTRFGRNEDGQFDPLSEKGGSLLQRFAIDPAAFETIPTEATVVAERQSTPLFGLGLIEAIPDSAIVEYAQAPKPDGVRGHISRVLDVATGRIRVGRFGWKAQQATLLSFAGDAYLNEMGITSRFFPRENAPNGKTALLEAFDRVADPEDQVDPDTGRGDVDALADFMRWLAPPPAQPLTEAARAGELLFAQVGCATCHRPVVTTGPNRSRALASKPVALYSDLLLHDMGELGDGIVQGDAGPRDMKTPPLWGLRNSAPYLHHGHAGTIDEAIRAHAGEATPARDRYRALDLARRQQLLQFLNSI